MQPSPSTVRPSASPSRSSTSTSRRRPESGDGAPARARDDRAHGPVCLELPVRAGGRLPGVNPLAQDVHPEELVSPLVPDGALSELVVAAEGDVALAKLDHHRTVPPAF